MIETIPNTSDLFHKFNKIKFHDDIHKYYLGDKNLISVTTILHKYQEPFDNQYWSEIKALEYDITQQEVIDMWEAWNVKSTTKGSLIHNYAELKFNNKVYAYNQDFVDKRLGEKNIEILKTYPIRLKNKVDSGLIPKMEGYTIKEEFDIVKKFVDKFYEDTFEKLIPIKTEFIVFDEIWSIAGMMDIIFWNVKYKCFQIYDYKTNKALNKTNDFNQKLKSPLSKLDDTHINIYSLQLSTYKAIIERNTDIKIEGLYLVWLNEINDGYKIFECTDYSTTYIPRIMEIEC